MKKVKIMLTAITIFAVVGGALAFKAKEIGWNVYKCDIAHNQCQLLTEKATNIGLDRQEVTQATFTNVDVVGAACDPNCTATVTVKPE